MTTLDLPETLDALRTSIREWRRLKKRSEGEEFSAESIALWQTSRCYIDAYQCVYTWLTGDPLPEETYELTPGSAAAASIIAGFERKCDLSPEGVGHVKQTRESKYCECGALEYFKDGTVAPSGWVKP